MSPSPPSPRELAALLPDEPRWVDLRGMLRSGRCDVFHGGDPRRGLVARSWDFPYAAAAGQLEPGVVASAVKGARGGRWYEDSAGGDWHLLAHRESVDAVARALSGWRRRGVVLHAPPEDGWPPAAGKAPEGVDVLLAPDGWAAAGLDLSHLPEHLAGEYESEHVRGLPLAAALVGGRAAAFCYAPYRTETLWDVSVDTLPGHRRRGLATACFRALAAHLVGQGLAPVWGSLAENEPSLRMAARLGFRPTARLTSFVAPAERSRNIHHREPAARSTDLGPKDRPP